MSGVRPAGPHGYLLLLVLLSGGAQANVGAADTFVSVQYENDMFARSGDRYYTSGLQLSMLQVQAPPAWLQRVADWTPFYQQGSGLNLVQYTVGQKMFTPDDIVASELQVNDRPYAGYIYFGASVLSQITHSDHFDYGNQFEITVGIVGPSAMGEQAQTFVHEIIGSDIPNGWDNQLKNEPALGLSYSRFWRLIQPLSDGLQFGVNPQISAVLGNVYTYGAGGVMFRLGNNLRRDLSPPNIRPGFPGVTYFQPGKQSSWYLYLGFESRLVLRDIFLDGNTFEDSHSVAKESLVGDMQYGLVYLFDDVRISVSNMSRTDEFTTQEKVTRYGALNLSFRY
jgi:hypothetical protein